MTDKSKTNIFGDRRKSVDRRQQRLPMPPGLDRRRSEGRRAGRFYAQPWWLRISYAAELVSENTIIESGFNNEDVEADQPDKKSSASKSKTPPTSNK